MYVPLRLGFFIIARHCASLFSFSFAFLLETAVPCIPGHDEEVYTV